MKIVHICICGEFYEEYAYQDNLLPKYHRKRGYEVTIVAATYSRFDQDTGKVIQDYSRCKFLEDGTKLIRLRPLLPLVLNSHIHLFYGLAKSVKAENPDFIFVHGVESPNYLFLSSYKIKHPSVRVVFDNHTDYVNSLHSPITRWWAKYIVGRIIVKHILWTSNHFYGTTPDRNTLLNEVYGVPEDKISLLPLGADDDAMCYENKDMIRAEVRRKLGVSDDEFLIVTGGKIDRKKNIHTLVEAVNKLHNGMVKILVFGSIVNDMKQVFDNLITERTIFIGWISSTDVYHYFYASDLVAFPGLHSALWEQAVASKVPTAFSEINGFKHVDVCGNCVFFRNNTQEEYMEVINELLTNADKYNRLLVNSQSHEVDIFRYSRIADVVLEDSFKDNN